MSPALEVVGRESEIDSVHDFLEAVPGGPVALLVEGEVGIGKTTLWRKGVAEAGERCSRAGRSRPRLRRRSPCSVISSETCRTQRSDGFPTRNARLSRSRCCELVRSPGGVQRRAVALGVLGAIRVLAEDTALVVAVDDAQWLDPP